MLTNGSVWQTSANVDEPIKGLNDTTRLKISRRSGKGLETRSKRLAAYRRATFSDPPTACGVHAAPCGRLGQPVSLVVLRNKLFFSWLPVEKFARGWSKGDGHYTCLHCLLHPRKAPSKSRYSALICRGVTGLDVCVTSKRPAAAHEAVAFSPQTAFSRGAKSPKRRDLAGRRGQKTDVKGHGEGQILDAALFERVNWPMVMAMAMVTSPWLQGDQGSQPASSAQEGMDAIYSGCCPLQQCLFAGWWCSMSNGMASRRPDIVLAPAASNAALPFCVAGQRFGCGALPTAEHTSYVVPRPRRRRCWSTCGATAVCRAQESRRMNQTTLARLQATFWLRFDGPPKSHSL
jgi:hypothetical protein